MKAEFEEKDFEAPLYSELKYGSQRIATPGQVFEGHFGIDAAIQALNPYFWGLYNYSIIPPGVVLDDFNFGFVWRKIDKKRSLPTFRTNLLIQAKRPTPMKKASPTLKPYGFLDKYWKFQITKHQQEILEKIANILKRRALVIYASAAFDTLSDLYNYTENQQIVENSNFVKVEKLQDHKCWYYNQAGTSGVAHSDPEYIEDQDFYSMINKAGNFSEEELEASDVSNNLLQLYKAIIETCTNAQEHNPIANYFLNYHNKLNSSDYISELEESRHFFSIHLFCNIMHLKWLVLK